MKNIEMYLDSSGNAPFEKWLNSISIEFQAKVSAYITRLSLGGCKNNIKQLKDGVFEIKIDYGPGLRVYFGEDGKTIVLLLIGGDKKTQKSDIKKAKEYWRDYEQNKKI